MTNTDRLHKKIELSGLIKIKTGIHIGDSKDSVEIGGVDLPVVRRKYDGQPYLPGSSIKGKMRCLLEQASGKVTNETGDQFRFEEGNKIHALFGCIPKKKKDEKEKESDSNPSRIIVRDAYLVDQSATFLKGLESTDMPYTEVKFENVINRVSGVAEHPRQIERVPAGAVFEVNFVINVFAPPKTDKETEEDVKKRVDKVEKDLLSTFKTAFNLLLDDYLGGHGSRGYGQIELVGGKLSKTVKEYKVEKGLLEITPPKETFVLLDDLCKCSTKSSD